MRLKDLFAASTGQKVTEKGLYRVLVVSICSILLCMSCLVGTTWAWFAVSIENTGNEIWIGEPKINLTVGGSAYDAGTELYDPDISLRMVHANETDDFDKKSTLYVTLTIQSDGGTTTVYTTLDESNNYSSAINIKNNTEKACSVRWEVSWFAPANAVALTDNTVTLEAEEPTEPSTQATTEAATESSTEASTEATTEPSTETVTEAATDTTDPSSEPTNETSSSTEETTGTTEGES